MPRKDIDFEFEAEPGHYGLLADTERYAVVPGALAENGTFVFVHLDRPAHPPWIVTENPDRTFTVTPDFRVGDGRVYLQVALRDGRWTSLAAP